MRALNLWSKVLDFRIFSVYGMVLGPDIVMHWFGTVMLYTDPPLQLISHNALQPCIEGQMFSTG